MSRSRQEEHDTRHNNGTQLIHTIPTIMIRTCVLFLLTLAPQAQAFVSPSRQNYKATTALEAKRNSFAEIAISTAAFAAVLFSADVSIANAVDGGASNVANSKITTGGASTLQSGRTIAITRGVNLDQSDFSNQNLRGVAFQQSVVRNANFKGANLFGASFFDATLNGSNFQGADLTQANLEMAQLTGANLHDTVARDMYVGGSSIFDGIKDIENSDWTDTFLSKYQKKLLCAHPTAFGTNPKTGVDTRESMMCVD